MNTVRLRKRIPMLEALKEALNRYPEAAHLLHELSQRGIFVQLDERGCVFWVATKGIPITIAHLRDFTWLRDDLTAICEAGNLRRQPIGAAS